MLCFCGCYFDKQCLPKRPSGAPLHTLSKLYDVPVGFVLPPPYFEAEYCLFCGRRRIAVARYWMICVVLPITILCPSLSRILMFDAASTTLATYWATRLTCGFLVSWKASWKFVLTINSCSWRHVSWFVFKSFGKFFRWYSEFLSKFVKEKNEEIWLSPDKSPHTDRKIKKATWQRKKPPKLRLHNDCGPT